jgi:tetratricopeptide (TPR) repeat protein
VANVFRSLALHVGPDRSAISRKEDGRMTERSTETVATLERPLSAEAVNLRTSPRAMVKRSMFVSTVLLIALMASACGSGGSSPSSTADSKISAGISAESRGQYQEALTDYNEAIAANPTNAIAYYDLGALYQEHLNEPNKAAAEYNKAMLAKPDYRLAMFNLAILDTPHSPLDAIALYKQILQFDPNDANTLFNLGLLLVGQSQSTAQGQSYLSKAISLDPSLASRVPKGVTP